MCCQHNGSHPKTYNPPPRHHRNQQPPTTVLHGLAIPHLEKTPRGDGYIPGDMALPISELGIPHE